MPRIRLDAKEFSQKRALGPLGVARDIVHLRLYIRLLLGQDDRPREAILDTGAPVSQFPIGTWEQIVGASEIIPDHLTAQVDALPLYTIAGCAYRARHAWVDVAVIDSFNSNIRLGTTKVFAALFVARVNSKTDTTQRHDQDGFRQIVMGIGAGVLDGRYLILSSHPDEKQRVAWLQDEKPAEPVISASSLRIPHLA